MAFGRERGEESTPKPTAPPAPPAPAAPTGGLTAFIDQGSSFEGKLSFKDTVRIDGHFSGEISSENTLVIGETGEIEASIRSKTVIISGSVSGDVVAATRVVLHKSARMQGNIESPSLMIEEGASFNGQISMHPSDSSKKGGSSFKAAKGDAPSPPDDESKG
jgi:cytoskeletal protein CcmA (bactofilin family)